MSSKIPFEFDISVSADKKRRAKNKGSSGALENSSRQCDVKGCELIGKYRAPKSPKNVDEFNWFCLKHVKEYNRTWNFFEGHSQQDLENQFKDIENEDHNELIKDTNTENNANLVNESKSITNNYEIEDHRNKEDQGYDQGVIDNHFPSSDMM